VIHPDGTVATVAMRKSSVSPFGSGAIDRRGAVTFRAYLKDGSYAIVTNDRGRITTVVQAQQPGLDNFGPVVVNNRGAVAFSATERDAAGGEVNGVYIVSEGQVSRVAEVGSIIRLPLSINDSASIAFLAGINGSPLGIFTGADPENEKVIAVGDLLFGSIATAVTMGYAALNESGQVAFHYSLEDGRTGIAVATPIP
jgi:hypothetical protein